MRWIYISPHLDDAVLSAGGFLYEQARSGIPVEIWTIVCGFPPQGELTPFAQVLHSVWGTGTAEETVKLRRAEDVEAARIIGAKTVHFDIPRLYLSPRTGCRTALPGYLCAATRSRSAAS